MHFADPQDKELIENQEEMSDWKDYKIENDEWLDH